MQEAHYTDAAKSLHRWMTTKNIEEDFTACDTAALNRFFADYRKGHTQGGTNTLQRNLAHPFGWLEQAYDHPNPYKARLNRYAPVKKRPATVSEELIKDMPEVTGGGRARSFEDVRDHAIIRVFTEGPRLTEVTQMEVDDLSADLIASGISLVFPSHVTCPAGVRRDLGAEPPLPGVTRNPRGRPVRRVRPWRTLVAVGDRLLLLEMDCERRGNHAPPVQPRLAVGGPRCAAPRNAGQAGRAVYDASIVVGDVHGHWLVAAEAWDTVTDAQGRVSPIVSDVSDMLIRTGRLAFANPAWTPRFTHRAPPRAPADLIADGPVLVTVITAAHHTVDGLARAPDSDARAIFGARRGGRLYQSRLTLPGWQKAHDQRPRVLCQDEPDSAGIHEESRLPAKAGPMQRKSGKWKDSESPTSTYACAPPSSTNRPRSQGGSRTGAARTPPFTGQHRHRTRRQP